MSLTASARRWSTSTLALTAAAVLQLVQVGCASQQGASTVGASEEAAWETSQDKQDEAELEASSDSNEDSMSPSEGKPAEGRAPEGEASIEPEPEGRPSAYSLAEAAERRRDVEYERLARLALRHGASDDNHLGLRLAISERAADLPWILVLENTSPNAVRLARDPSLLRFEVEAPAKAPPPAGDETGSEAPPATDVSTITCGPTTHPKSLNSDDVLELGPGQLLYFPFDPRRVCSDPEILIEGSKVTVTYGFFIQTKKVWQKGKLVTVESEQTQPFVAEAADPESDMVGVKKLVAQPFVLGATYPLSSVRLDPEGAEANDMTPPPVFSLTIAEMGKRSSPELTSVRVTVKNVSNETRTIFLRRELISYEVIGPWESVSCKMAPSDRSPDRLAFATLSPGETRTLDTRLAEACPQETWSIPGTYSVSARLTATASGAEHEMNAFVGEVETTRAAQLVIPGNAPRSPMRIVSAAP